MMRRFLLIALVMTLAGSVPTPAFSRQGCCCRPEIACACNPSGVSCGGELSEDNAVQFLGVLSAKISTESWDYLLFAHVVPQRMLLNLDPTKEYLPSQGERASPRLAFLKSTLLRL
ncbi:MAG: hypothetical protein JW937_00820 [Candidatus Omnitrophica bacterium]|nr:hypothetical protein [Candidatus Omnitrophota bacterium]